MAFVFLAAWYAAACFMLLRLMPKLPAPSLVAPRAGESALAHLVTNAREVVGRPWPRVILSIVFLEGMTMFGAFAFVATHVHTQYGMSLTLAGSVALMFGLGGLSFALASRWLVRRLGESGMAGMGRGIHGPQLPIGGTDRLALAADRRHARRRPRLLHAT